MPVQSELQLGSERLRATSFHRFPYSPFGTPSFERYSSRAACYHAQTECQPEWNPTEVANRVTVTIENFGRIDIPV